MVCSLCHIKHALPSIYTFEWPFSGVRLLHSYTYKLVWGTLHEWHIYSKAYIAGHGFCQSLPHMHSVWACRKHFKNNHEQGNIPHYVHIHNLTKELRIPLNDTECLLTHYNTLYYGMQKALQVCDMYTCIYPDCPCILGNRSVIKSIHTC